MARELKELIVGDFERRFGELTGCVLIDYQGLDSEKTADLRRELRRNGVRMAVVHNRLARRSLGSQEGVPEAFLELLRGPTAILYGEDGALSASKVIERWHRGNRGLAPIKGGLFEGRALDVAQVDELAKIPDVDTLRQTVAGFMASPLQALASAARSVVEHFARCAEARRSEIESEGSEGA